MDELLTQHDCKEFLDALLDHYRREPSDTLLGVWMDNLTTIATKGEEYVTVMGWILSNPPERMPSVHEVKSMLRHLRSERTPQLPEAKPSHPKIDVEQMRQNRINFLKGIYKHQGDTAFYRSMLSGNGGVFSSIVDNAFQAQKIDPWEVLVSHEDVMESMQQRVVA